LTGTRSLEVYRNADATLAEIGGREVSSVYAILVFVAVRLYPTLVE